MSDNLTPNDFKHESIEEEMQRKGTKDIPDWLNVKKQVGTLAHVPPRSAVYLNMLDRFLLNPVRRS